MSKSKLFLILLIVVLSTIAYIIGCVPPTSCIAEGTLIATPTGDKLIEELQIGDLVYSYDLATQKLQSSKVLFIKKSIQPCYQFQVSDEISLTATLSHPIYSPQTQRYELAESWFNNKLQDFAHVQQNQKFMSLTKESVVSVGKKVVYDITVESQHSNFIANGFLVHNKSYPPQSTEPIVDLAVISKTDSSITMHWTIPGDSFIYAVSYDMRISDSGFANNRWDQDTVPNMPTPSLFGGKDTIEVYGLDSQKKYWFIIQTYSNKGFYSNFVNEVVDSTL